MESDAQKWWRRAEGGIKQSGVIFDINPEN